MLDQSETPLASAVDAYLADPGIVPFSTPGHKRAPHLVDEFLRNDLPLSTGADDLHLTGDVLGRSERLAAELWGAGLCRFCTNGSTQGNQTLALAAARPGDRVIVSRNLHKSLLSGFVLAGLEPVWIRPDVDAPPACRSASRSPGSRRRSPARRTPAPCSSSSRPTSASSPTSLRSRTAAHAHGVPLLVDQAWGAHFGFHPAVPPNALALGADALVASAHKTLSSFTQGAYLFARGDLLDLARVDEAFEALFTTSVAAAILASLDRTRALMAARGEELVGEAVRLAGWVREELRRSRACGSSTRTIRRRSSSCSPGRAPTGSPWSRSSTPPA